MTKKENLCASCELLNELIYKHNEWSIKIYPQQSHSLHCFITIYYLLIPPPAKM